MEMTMVSRTVTITNPTGLHLQPAGKLCELAVRYKAEIRYHHGSTFGNAKSLLGVLGACIKCGDEVEFICSGDDEEEALQAIVDVIQRGFE
jgi:phosphocarrier protein HPr